MKKYEGNPFSEVLHAHKLSVDQFSLIADADHTIVYQSLEGCYTHLPRCIRCGLEVLGVDTNEIERQYHTYRLALRERLLGDLRIKDVAQTGR